MEILKPKIPIGTTNEHKCQLEEKYPETIKYLTTNKNIRKCPKCKCWVEREPGGDFIAFSLDNKKFQVCRI